jgi:hypothetical protein
MTNATTITTAYLLQREAELLEELSTVHIALQAAFRAGSLEARAAVVFGNVAQLHKWRGAIVDVGGAR